MSFLPARRSLRLMPGVRLNFGRVISRSLAGHPAHCTVAHGHVRKTISIPGIGVSYTTVSAHRPRGNRQITSADATLMGLILMGWIMLTVVKTLAIN